MQGEQCKCLIVLQVTLTFNWLQHTTYTSRSCIFSQKPLQVLSNNIARGMAKAENFWYPVVLANWNSSSGSTILHVEAENEQAFVWNVLCICRWQWHTWLSISHIFYFIWPHYACILLKILPVLQKSTQWDSNSLTVSSLSLNWFDITVL